MRISDWSSDVCSSDLEVAKRVSKQKPVIALKAGRTALGARTAASHTGALAGNDKIYDDVLRQSGVIRAKTLNDMLQFARGVPILPTPKGENVIIITGAGGRSEEHTSELQSLMRNSYAGSCFTKKINNTAN